MLSRFFRFYNVKNQTKKRKIPIIREYGKLLLVHQRGNSVGESLQAIVRMTPAQVKEYSAGRLLSWKFTRLITVSCKIGLNSNVGEFPGRGPSPAN